MLQMAEFWLTMRYYTRERGRKLAARTAYAAQVTITHILFRSGRAYVYYLSIAPKWRDIWRDKRPKRIMAKAPGI